MTVHNVSEVPEIRVDLPRQRQIRNCFSQPIAKKVHKFLDKYDLTKNFTLYRLN